MNGKELDVNFFYYVRDVGDHPKKCHPRITVNIIRKDGIFCRGVARCSESEDFSNTKDEEWTLNYLGSLKRYTILYGVVVNIPGKTVIPFRKKRPSGMPVKSEGRRIAHERAFLAFDNRKSSMPIKNGKDFRYATSEIGSDYCFTYRSDYDVGLTIDEVFLFNRIMERQKTK